MRSKVTLVLLFLNVALFFFIFRFENSWRTERATLETRRRVLGAEAADIRTLEVSSQTPGLSFRLEKRGDDWFLTKPIEWPANLNAVNRMLYELQFLEHETSFSARKLAENGQSLADYGLDHPKVIISFTSGENANGSEAYSTVLRIGDATKVGDRLYLLSPDGETIQVVRSSLADSLLVPLSELRSDNLFTIPVFEASSLSLQSTALSRVRVRVRREGSRWTFETPFIARANTRDTELVINSLYALRVKSFVMQNLPAALPSASPDLRVTLEGNNRHETLFIGGPAGPAADHVYYGQLEGRSAVFTVALPPELMDPLQNAADVLRDTHILDFDPQTVTAITLDAPNQPELVLQRLETPLAGAEDGWQIVERGSGPQGPKTLAADHANVRQLLDRLQLLTAKAFQSDFPTTADLENWGFNSPEREIALTLGGPSPTVVKLQIGLPTRRENTAYARIEGTSSIYAIDPDLLRETPLAPLAWRDRLLRDLPASARITRLTLTVLGPPGRTVLYQHKLAEGETWDSALAAEPEPKRSALRTLLNQMRTLRARSLVQEGFANPVLAGEAQPWRYEVEVAIALPGGTDGGRTDTSAIDFTDRVAGTEQFAGSKEFGLVFSVEQPLVDALWTLTYSKP